MTNYDYKLLAEILKMLHIIQYREYMVAYGGHAQVTMRHLKTCQGRMLHGSSQSGWGAEWINQKQDEVTDLEFWVSLLVITCMHVHLSLLPQNLTISFQILKSDKGAVPYRFQVWELGQSPEAQKDLHSYHGFAHLVDS